MPCRMSLIKSFPTFLFPHYRYCAPLGLGAILSRDCLAVDGKRCQPCAFATSPMKARLLCCALFFPDWHLGTGFPPGVPSCAPARHRFALPAEKSSTGLAVGSTGGLPGIHPALLEPRFAVPTDKETGSYRSASGGHLSHSQRF